MFDKNNLLNKHHRSIPNNKNATIEELAEYTIKKLDLMDETTKIKLIADISVRDFTWLVDQLNKSKNKKAKALLRFFVL